MRGILAGVAWFGIFISLHFAIFHFMVIRARIRWLSTIAFLTFPAYAWIYLSLPEDIRYLPSILAAPSDFANFLNGVLLFVFLFMGYGQYLYMVESSVSVRTLVELLQSSDRGLTFEELDRRYSQHWMMDRRLRRLVNTGYLTERSGVFVTTPRGRMVAIVFGWLKGFLKLGPGG